MSHLTLNVVAGMIGADAAPVWLNPLKAACSQFEIDTPERIAAFLAQAAHESAGFTRLEENLNYSESRLLVVFKKYFTPTLAKAYARNPEAIANRVYANRMGNGDEESGDGWKNRGRGLFQLTGADNYRRCGEGIGIDLLANPDLLTRPHFAAMSAAWFWNDRGLNAYADVNDFVAISGIINVGHEVSEDKINGMGDRLAKLKTATELFA